MSSAADTVTPGGRPTDPKDEGNFPACAQDGGVPVLLMPLSDV